MTVLIRYALTKIKGLGINFADIVCTIAGVNRQDKAGNLSDEEIKKLNQIIEHPTNSIFLLGYSTGVKIMIPEKISTS